MQNTVLMKSLFYFAVIQIAGMSANATEIQLRKSARVSGSLVRLGDIAVIKSDDAEQEEALSKIELFPAPTAGKSLSIAVGQLRTLLELREVDLAAHRLKGPTTIRVRARRVPVVVEARQASQAAPAAESTAKPIVVARRDLPRGTRIVEADVELRPDTPTSRTTPVDRLADAIGKEVTRPIKADAVVDRRQLQKPIVVRRRELVEVTARTGGITVQTTARALDDGAVEDLIWVETPERKKYAVRVTGDGKAVVDVVGVANRTDEGFRVSKQPTARRTR